MFTDPSVRRLQILEALVNGININDIIKHITDLNASISEDSTVLNCLKSLENEFQNSEKFINVESLLDALIIFYDECCHSSLRREKTVSDFLEICKYKSCVTNSIQ